MERNIGNADRVVRFIIGLILLYVAIAIDNKIVIILASMLAGISLVESYTGFCGIYKMLKINTNKGG